MGDTTGDEALYPIAVLIDELRNEDVQVRFALAWFDLILIREENRTNLNFCFSSDSHPLKNCRLSVWLWASSVPDPN